MFEVTLDRESGYKYNEEVENICRGAANTAAELWDMVNSFSQLIETLEQNHYSSYRVEVRKMSCDEIQRAEAIRQSERKRKSPKNKS